MSIESWLSFVLASTILTMTPGPSILLGVVHAMSYGVKNTLYTALGDISANFIQMVLVAVGLGAIIASSELAFQIIKWFGVVTLLYMGVKMLLAKPAVQPQIADGDMGNVAEQYGQVSEQVPEQVSRFKLFRSGFMVAAGNPKAIIFFTAFFPQFIDPSRPLFEQMLIMCPTMALLDFTWVMAYAISAKRCLGFMQHRPMFFNRASGSALLAASGYLAFSSKTATS